MVHDLEKEVKIINNQEDHVQLLESNTLVRVL